MPKKSTTFQGVLQERAAGAVTRQLEELILTGIYRPGDKLPPERDLVKLIDVSRPTLRTAIKDLEERGLLVARQGGGTFVADTLGSMFSQPIVQLFQSNKRATADYLEFRKEIDALSARYAARRATSADRQILTHLIERMKEAHEHEDFTDEASIDIDFHMAVGEAAHNVVLLHTLRSCYELLRSDVFFNRSMLYQLPGAREQLLEQHCAICDAVLSSSPDEADEAARKHMRFVEESMRDAESAFARQRTAAKRLDKLRDDEAKLNRTEGG